MSESPAAIPQTELSAGWKAIRFFHGILIFLILGPPIGSLVFSIWVFADAIKSLLWTHAHPSLDLFGVLIVLPFISAFTSYIFGWLPALISGIVVSAGQIYCGGMNRRNAALAAILISPVAPAFMYANASDGSAHAPTLSTSILLAIASIAGTMSCWWILRKGGLDGYTSAHKTSGGYR